MSPFEGVRHSGTSASNSSGAPAGGPFGSRGVHMSTSVDTTNSNSGQPSGGHADHPSSFRGLASSASQKERQRSPKDRESPFETVRHQQQQQVPCCAHFCQVTLHLFVPAGSAAQHWQISRLQTVNIMVEMQHLPCLCSLCNFWHQNVFSESKIFIIKHSPSCIV